MQVDSSESDPSVQAAKPLVSAIVAPPTSVINTPINCSARQFRSYDWTYFWGLNDWQLNRHTHATATHFMMFQFTV